MILRKNVTGTVATELVAIGKNLTNVKSISITAVTAAVADLYIQNTSDTFYLIKGVTIPLGTILELDSNFLRFDNSTSGYGLFIKLTSGSVNIPNDDQLHFMEIIAEKIFEPLRVYVGGPIKITSFFRCPELNTAIGGSKTSQHCKGQAMDIDDVFGYKTNAEMYHYIKENLNFDQLIWEFGDDENPAWVHVSYVSDEKNRNRCLKAYKEDGKTKYKVI